MFSVDVRTTAPECRVRIVGPSAMPSTQHHRPRIGDRGAPGKIGGAGKGNDFVEKKASY